MKTRTVCIKSFGCQMNKLDTALVSSALRDLGCTFIDSYSEADIVLINTCSVREHAENRVFSHLGHLQHAKKTRPDVIVVVFGCMAQRLGAKLLEHPAVNIVAGPAQIPEIPTLIEQAIHDFKPRVLITEKIRQKPDVSNATELEDFESIHDSDDKQIPGQAFIRAMRGCNKFCTYCIVPYVRGPEISRPPQAIVSQAKNMANQGIKQITLLGQTINRYSCTDNNRTYNLGDILEMVSQIEGIQWVRFITSHPADFDDNILHAIANNEKLCPYLHVPAQSGSNKILKAMNRDYTVEQYLGLINRARKIVPGISISSDFIVGFPGETHEDFEQTLQLIQKARFKNSFIFKYSPRPGTTAVNRLEDDICEEVKKQRNSKLLEIQNKISEEDNAALLGKTVTVLVEGLSKKPHLNMAQNQNNPQLIARTAHDHIVVFNGPESLTGNFAEVEITKTASLTLFGQLASD